MLQSQEKIGWRFITRGILSKHWRELYVSSLARNEWSTTTVDDPAFVDPNDLLDLETISLSTISSDDLTSYDTKSDTDSVPSVPTNPKTRDNTNVQVRTSDPVVFFAGLIKTIWVEMGALWRHHQASVHQANTAIQSPIKLDELKTRVRLIQFLQPRVLVIHRSLYFPADIEAFLSTATIRQLQSYVTFYQPVIMASIRSAEKQAVLLPLVMPLPQGQLESTTQMTQHPALEEASHRKRNRLRTLSLVVLWIIGMARR